MQIYFKRTGGFMGQPIMRVVDTTVLPDETAVTLQTLVHQADFFELPTEAIAPPNGDQFEYTLLIDDGSVHHHTVKRCDGSVSDKLWPLLRELTTLARTEHSRPIEDFPN
mgnify:CR=1 FL=1